MQPYEDLAVVRRMVRHILPGQPHLAVERVQEGRSTAVYRITGNDSVYYLRVLPETDASFAPESYVHATLQAQSLHIPEVLYFEPYNALLQRSVMLTTAITGQAIGHGSDPLRVGHIVRSAGDELARLNSLQVQGFGWVLRTPAGVNGLHAEYATCQEWLAQHFDAPLHTLRQSQVFSVRDNQAIQAALAEAIRLFGSEPAVLAHGDFDATHIYHHEGQYTGIIDFGEIRGAHPLYDIGHFWIENRNLLPSLLEGYTEVAALPADCWDHIHLTGLLIAARRLGRSLARQANVHEPDVQAVRRALHILNL